MAALQVQLREVISVNMELTNAVDSLQTAVKHLEIRVEDLQLQMQHINHEAEHFDVHTPRSGQNEPDALHDWYDGQNAQMETFEPASLLLATSRAVTLDPNLTDRGGAVNQSLRDQNYGQLESRAQGSQHTMQL
jgi:hypothetical protein